MTYEDPTYEEAIKWVNDDFQMRYKKTLDDMVIEPVRGYWRQKEPCKGECGMGHTQPLCHTYYFAQPGKGRNGRFLKPYRAWEVIRSERK